MHLPIISAICGALSVILGSFKDQRVNQRLRNSMNKEFEATIKSFLDKYEHSDFSLSGHNIMEMDILNSNFTVQETEAAIDYLKNNKSPGCDNIPAEFIKFCKEISSDDLTTIYNYIIESQDFPEIWAEGLRSAIFKGGIRNVVKNYRGITILSIFAKIF